MVVEKKIKIPKEQLEIVNRRWTDDTIVKGKGQKDKQRSTKHSTEN
jgi:hypothetical protein